jgi:hypothetical protein
MGRSPNIDDIWYDKFLVFAINKTAMGLALGLCLAKSGWGLKTWTTLITVILYSVTCSFGVILGMLEEEKQTGLTYRLMNKEVMVFKSLCAGIILYFSLFHLISFEFNTTLMKVDSRNKPLKLLCVGLGWTFMAVSTRVTVFS